MICNFTSLATSEDTEKLYEQFYEQFIGRIDFLKDSLVVDFIGGPCRDRTCDHLIKSQML